MQIEINENKAPKHAITNISRTIIKKIQLVPKVGALGFTANVNPRKQSSVEVPKFHRFSSRLGSETI